MRLPRDLSGGDFIKVLCRDFAYREIKQEGSHRILETDTPRRHRIAVPDHRTLRVGTLNAMLNAVSRAKGIDKQDIVEKL